MKQRTGKECKKIDCKNYHDYSHWVESVFNGSSALKECRECKYAHVSQYIRKANPDGGR